MVREMYKLIDLDKGPPLAPHWIPLAVPYPFLSIPSSPILLSLSPSLSLFPCTQFIIALKMTLNRRRNFSFVSAF